jgi:hypothetical protein
MNFYMKIIQGYTKTQSGGNSVIQYTAPDSSSMQITTIPVGKEFHVTETRNTADGRMWLNLESDGLYQPGWIIGVGNTGSEYVVPTDVTSTLAQIYATEKAKYEIAHPPISPTNGFNFQIQTGYSQNKTGGDTVIIYSEPDATSFQRGTLPVGASYSVIESRITANGRLWLHVQDSYNFIDGWIIGKGSSGQNYGYITDQEYGLDQAYLKLKELYDLDHPPLGANSTFSITIKEGYTQDAGGGNTIIIYQEPDSNSKHLGTVPVGQSYTVMKSQISPDGRMWMFIDSSDQFISGWIIGRGNTGTQYVDITGADFEVPELYNVLKTAYDNANNITNPALQEDTGDIVNSSENLAAYNSPAKGDFSSIKIDPEGPDKSAVDVTGSTRHYTESFSHSPDKLNVTGGMVDNVKMFNIYRQGKMIEQLDSIKKNFSALTLSEVGQLKHTLIQNFNRFKIDFPDYHLNKTFSFVFFTRPDLLLYTGETIEGDQITLHPQVANDPLYYYLDQSDRELLSSLTFNFSRSHSFLPFLSNLAESFDIQDEFIKTGDYGETYTGYKIQYGKHNIESKTAGSFNVSYIDDKNLSVYKIHKAWVEYISKVFRGEIKPRRDYIHKKIIDYASSVYYVMVGPDGETILFWSKYYGIFPTHTPSSSMGFTKGSMVKLPEYSLSYSYSMKEDFNPFILVELNAQAEAGDYVYQKTYIPQLAGCGNTFVGTPFIETHKNSLGQYTFKLRFRPKGG